MRKYLIPEIGNFYKANLHSHSSITDGELSPSELKTAYKSNGYSILAITDHEVLVNHSDLTKDDFLMINGYEIAFTQENAVKPNTTKVCHINLFATGPNNDTAVCFNPQNALYCKDKSIVASQKYLGEIYKKEYSIKEINYVISEANKNGFIVQYNHPTWSLETFNEYGKYEGFFAMEIFNSTSDFLGTYEYNPQIYDAVLRSGKRIFCTATDDKHSSHTTPVPLTDSFLGFTMIKAAKLDYSSVISALINGDFYASLGPEVYELYVENKKAYIRCSDAKHVYMTTDGRRGCHKAADFGKAINEAVFDIEDDDGYIRFDVVDEEGKRANTRAYFLDMLAD